MRRTRYSADQATGGVEQGPHRRCRVDRGIGLDHISEKSNFKATKDDKSGRS
jgi:hypothetical protein